MKHLLRFAFAVACCAVAAGAFGQDYPSRPIRFVVPFAPGGGTDITARIVGNRLTEAWRQMVVIDNRSGAAGNIGMDIAAKSAGDGYTMVLASATHSLNPATHRKLSYDLVKDFAPVTQMTSQPYILVVHPSVAAKSIKELVALAKATPAGLTYGSSGTGGTSHLSGAMLGSLSGANLVHVPYKGGGPGLMAVVAGEINMIFATPLESQPHIKTGRIRALAVSTVTRSKANPELPTVAEAGVPGFEFSGWYGILLPAATPHDIVAKLNKETVRIVQLPEIMQQFAKDGVETAGTTVEQFTKHIGSEVAKWKRVAREAGIQPE
jgi:tripartite-type tricarboxylate transporter receptor subunit TctC